MRPFRGPKVAYTRRKPSRQLASGRVIETNPNIVAACVPLWKHCAERAHSRYGTEKPGGNHMGRDAALYSVDDRLREYGITWADRELYLAYERAVRRAATGAR